MNLLQTAGRWIRSPALIVGELAALVLLCAVGAAVPQTGLATARELARLRALGPPWVELVDRLGMDHVFRHPLFLVVTLLAAASLASVTVGQIRRFLAGWRRPLAPEQFRAAPYRLEFERPARPEAGGRPPVRLWTERRLGGAGLPLFHLGLLLVMLAGAVRALFSAQAMADLLEGETLAAGPAAWAWQGPALWAAPVSLREPVTLKAVEWARYPGGDLKELRLRMAPGESAPDRVLAVNRGLPLPGARLFLGQDFGPAALVEWADGAGGAPRHAVLLADVSDGRYEGSLDGPGGAVAHLRADLAADGSRPARAEVRVMKGGGLAATETLRPGETLPLPGGAAITLHGIPLWARVRGTRDPSRWLAYAGLGLAAAGATVIFGVIRVDGCVMVTPMGDREHVMAALRPHRFAPLFDERFQRLLREEGAPA